MKKLYLAAAVVAPVLLTSCIPVLIGGAATGGVVAAQERTTGNAVDDSTIKVTLDAKFGQQDTADLLRNVVTHVTEGRVMLTGDVDKPDSKTEAVRIAWTVNGVKEVMDEIQVNDKTGVVDYAQDSWIANQIRTKLLVEKDLRSVNYSVEVVNGVVYLMGIAQNQEELNKATYLASTTSHVKQVISHVILKEDQRRAIK